MIQLLFLLLFAEGAVALLLMVKIGLLRELAMRAVDQAKEGKGPAAVKTLACTLLVIFMSSVASILKIQNRGLKLGTVSPMDQVLWRTHLLEASLIGSKRIWMPLEPENKTYKDLKPIRTRIGTAGKTDTKTSITFTNGVRFGRSWTRWKAILKPHIMDKVPATKSS